MTWATVERVLAVIGALSIIATVGLVGACWLLTRSTESLNRHSSYR